MGLIKSNKMQLVSGFVRWENDFVLDLSAGQHNKMGNVKTVWVKHKDVSGTAVSSHLKLSTSLLPCFFFKMKIVYNFHPASFFFPQHKIVAK